jgi:hypothetical protein
LSASLSPAFAPCGIPPEELELLDVVAGALELLDVVVAGLLLDDWDEDELEPPPQPASASASATSAVTKSRLWVELPTVIRSSFFSSAVCAA